MKEYFDAEIEYVELLIGALRDIRSDSIQKAQQFIPICHMHIGDDFKNYNDQYGHTAGDIVLKAISNSLRSIIGQRGVISRFGGEEFSIFLPEAANKEAKQIAEQLRKDIKAVDIQFRRVKTNVTVSIGLASFPLDGKFVDELIQKADERLYIAKRQGKDRVVS